MWVAQHPCGTWCAYKEKPIERISGWDGEVYAVLDKKQYLISWRQTLTELPLKEYQDRYRHRELK